MIGGKVSIATRQAQIEIRVRGPHATEVSLMAVVDTGFTEFLTFPLLIITNLNLAFVEVTAIRLANGEYKDVAEYAGQLWWNEVWRSVQVQASEGDVLLGMSVLIDHSLTVEVVESGDVTIELVEH